MSFQGASCLGALHKLMWIFEICFCRFRNNDIFSENNVRGTAFATFLGEEWIFGCQNE